LECVHQGSARSVNVGGGGQQALQAFATFKLLALLPSSSGTSCSSKNNRTTAQPHAMQHGRLLCTDTVAAAFVAVAVALFAAAFFKWQWQ
jgi:hypothetical protein